DTTHGRAISLGELDAAWSLPDDCPEWFGLFIAADATGVDDDRVAGLAAAAIVRKCAYISVWGPGCETAHDVFDDVYIDGGSPEPFMMSPWHSRESLPSALWFALFSAYPSHADDDVDWSFVALAEEPWYGEVRGLLVDQQRLHDA